MIYLVRLDDASPTMDRAKWGMVLNILDRYGVKPLIGVIPNCKDPKMSYMVPEDEVSFWDRVREWQSSEYTLALHGYDHCYISPSGGINPINPRSEFAGIPLDEQRRKLREGYRIMNEQGVSPSWFFAPSHTYDENTLIALKEETDIRMISDTVALRPYSENGFTFYPLQSGHFFTPPLNGVWTFCFHPSTMSDDAIDSMERFIIKYQDHFGRFGDDSIPVQERKSWLDKLLSKAYFSFRKCRKKFKF